MAHTPPKPDGHLDVDLLVVGAGAGGFTGALAASDRGLRVLIVEKAPQFGGSTALSGGGIWVPGADALLRDGYSGTEQEALTYLEEITAGEVSRERLIAYMQHAPAAIDFLESLGSRLQFAWKPDYPDYFPELPGGSAQGRSINAAPIDLRELGVDEPLLLQGPGIRGFWLTSRELRTLYTLRQSWAGKAMFGKVLWRMLRARFTGERINTLGAALAARLFLAARDAGIPLWLDAPLTDLISTDDGTVAGARVRRHGREVTVSARGVLLTSGGFDHNRELRRRFQPELTDDWSLGSPHLTGDALTIAQRLGAATDLMDSAWWFPVIDWPDGRRQFLLNERMIPGQFIVNGAGRRYVNESAPYTEFGRAMIRGQQSGAPHIPSWLIMDTTAWRNYVVAGHLPLPKIPFAPVPTGKRLPRTWREGGAVRTADSLAGLAREIGVDPAELQRTADRFNKMARRGVDDDFRRGASAYDNYYGDTRLTNPNLAEVRRAPFYAFRIVPGDLGTNGGLLTDTDGRVLHTSGGAIRRLFAAGNVTASVMGHSYAGPGATIGPSIAFAYAAATALSREISTQSL
ncbi:FAD-binding protein [Microbacterium sp. 22303]|uniref:FAD-binding protein n=1 Tax=Microbacterium sp. 22303 TaxID=3453905 RepID=UPI003F854F5E